MIRFTAYFLFFCLDFLPQHAHALPSAYYVVSGKNHSYILHNDSSQRTDSNNGLWQLRLIARPTNQQPQGCIKYAENQASKHCDDDTNNNGN